MEPGDTITYTLTVGNDSDATGDLVNPQITDCVPFSSHLVVDNIVLGAGWSLEAGTPIVGGCTPTAPATAGSGTNDPRTNLAFRSGGPRRLDHLIQLMRGDGHD